MSAELYKIFPAKLRERLAGIDLIQEGYTELRFRCNEPLILLKGREEFYLHKSQGLQRDAEEAYRVSVNEIREMMEYISNFSAYAYEEELRQGFLTIQGGHRIGICGKVVLWEGKIKTIRNVSFLNVRLAREKKGCADGLLPYLFEGDRLCHTLIVSPPGCGKTTILRDLIRQLSEGVMIRKEEKNIEKWKETGSTKWLRGRKVGVVDERSELAACYHGVPQNDLGSRTDVLDGCPKVLGMELLLRSMSPEVIAVDELGGEADAAMVQKSIYCGCTILATAHGEGYAAWFSDERVLGKKGMEAFERFVFLKSDVAGQVEKICDNTGHEVKAAW